MRTRPWVAFSVLSTALCALPGCGGARESAAQDSAGESCAEALELEFVPDTLGRDEAYVCFGFERSSFAGETVGGVAWDPPKSGAFLLHHAILYALPADFPDGPVVCDGMPDAAVGLHVWSPGGDDLKLPPDVGLVLPEGTQRFVVEAHTLRVGNDSVESGRVRICNGPSAPRHLAALMGTSAPVPAIRPMHEEISEGSCVLDGALHFFSVWPHMHRVGRDISAELVRPSESATLVHVSDWDFNLQRTYALDVDARPGDAVRVRCVWENPGSEYVLPGPKTENEMCNAVFIAWPAANAVCR